MSKLNELTITEARELLDKKQISAQELTMACLAQIKEAEKKIGAFLFVNKDQAMAEAKKVDAAIKAGETVGALAGIPVAVKDNLLVDNLPCTAGSKMLQNYQAVYDATVVKKLKQYGAIILGKTNMDEFAMGSSTETSAFNVTHNPRDLKTIPGGSSGGSAAAVAANECLFALGSDTGGSIRQPASLCGVVGLKPTYGSVSRYGLIAMSSSLDVIGPLTKTVSDARTVFEIIKGKDKKDSTSKETEIKNCKLIIKNLRIGVPKEYFVEGMDLQTEKLIRRTLEKLKKQGATLVDVSLPHTEYGLAVYYILMPAEVSANLARFDGIRYGYSEFRNPKSEIRNLYEIYTKSRAQGFGDEVKRRVMIGSYVLSAGYRDAFYNKAQMVRSLIKQDFDKVFKEVDCLITPTSPTVAWPLGERVTDPLTMYLSDIFTVSANLAGVPAISLPCGEDNGLPVGLQIMAPQFGEEVLFEVGEQIERLVGK
ncbi:MAG: Asp-tRNA(Asn)/Glu-tRNA(Gln) amidotransferase subunit GatA [bacterium]|nr:Asp-tRNA(Asn)/Glu-tRNA(Gln) amidotransferase subunit GatA [bacterium]